VVQVLRSVYEAMIAHARAESPNECCGLLAGRNGTITRHFPMANVAENKTVRYEAAPPDVRRILDEIDGAGEQHLGIYHSHPKSEAKPSATDCKLAAYDVPYVIISLKMRGQPIVRAFRLRRENSSDEAAVPHDEAFEPVDGPR
jgi:proteasome lid subunit RPN8/RPN11